jgi:NadR type nicotinamide-nucleotide adenylyltransferase
MEKLKNKIIRIALIGPESTGKTTLTLDLAKQYKSAFVPEYARTYLASKKRKYTLADVIKIARGQLLQEKAWLITDHKFLFADTELINAKVWCEDVFKQAPEWILDNIPKYKYDFYLLTYPDLPWKPDPLRENPMRRDYFFKKYEHELRMIKADYAIIRGTGEARLLNAIQAIDSKFK